MECSTALYWPWWTSSHWISWCPQMQQLMTNSANVYNQSAEGQHTSHERKLLNPNCWIINRCQPQSGKRPLEGANNMCPALWNSLISRGVSSKVLWEILGIPLAGCPVQSSRAWRDVSCAKTFETKTTSGYLHEYQRKETLCQQRSRENPAFRGTSVPRYQYSASRSWICRQTSSELP